MRWFWVKKIRAKLPALFFQLSSQPSYRVLKTHGRSSNVDNKDVIAVEPFLFFFSATGKFLSVKHHCVWINTTTRRVKSLKWKGMFAAPTDLTQTRGWWHSVDFRPNNLAAARENSLLEAEPFGVDSCGFAFSDWGVGLFIVSKRKNLIP